MKSKKAYIRWTGRLYDNGRLNLKIGMPYYPHIVLKNDLYKTEWSVRFIVSKPNTANEAVVHLEMLVNNEASNVFWGELSSGTEFYLLEGTAQVAYGYII